ncbi:MAG TPA: CPBP family intramembrane metalloprotease [Povalibacter sp.]|uniref:CPBP family intramembrane glutamic endopeptidase n=1 Tax=Povalibacter sp. TaxID=1962978 RepID=UPI002D13A016|nr:CPBP family intramembrane glutamic endopeptidase [Povalibacter sp.]HMN44605.1 CPBP family intramembrane metalloprotease [Povalibacter sp.]
MARERSPVQENSSRKHAPISGWPSDAQHGACGSPRRAARKLRSRSNNHNNHASRLVASRRPNEPTNVSIDRALDLARRCDRIVRGPDHRGGISSPVDGFHYGQGPGGVLIALLMGIALTSVYLWKRNVVAVMLAHFLVDFIPIIVLPLLSGD